MWNLLELDDEVAGEVALTVISFLVEGEICGLLVARLDLHIHLFSLSLGGSTIMLKRLSFILYLLETSIVEFVEGALQLNHNVLWRRSQRLVLSSEGVSKQTAILV